MNTHNVSDFKIKTWVTKQRNHPRWLSKPKPDSLLLAFPLVYVCETPLDILATLWKSCSQRQLCVPQHGEQMARPGRHGCLEEKKSLTLWDSCWDPTEQRERAGVCICRCVCLTAASCLSTCSCQSCLPAPQCVMSQSRCRTQIAGLFFSISNKLPISSSRGRSCRKFHHLNVLTALVFSHSGVVDVGQLMRTETQPRVSIDARLS